MKESIFEILDFMSDHIEINIKSKMRYVRINFTAVTPRLSQSEQRYTDADKLRSMRLCRPRGAQSGEDATRGINNV